MKSNTKTGKNKSVVFSSKNGINIDGKNIYINHNKDAKKVINYICNGWGYVGGDYLFLDEKGPSTIINTNSERRMWGVSNNKLSVLAP